MNNEVLPTFNSIKCIIRSKFEISDFINDIFYHSVIIKKN